MEDTFALHVDQSQQREVLKWLIVLLDQKLPQASAAYPVTPSHVCTVRTELMSTETTL